MPGSRLGLHSSPYDLQGLGPINVTGVAGAGRWVQGRGRGGELSLRGSSGLPGHHLGQTSGASACSGPTSCRGRALGQRVARTHSCCLRLTSPPTLQDQYQLCYRAALEYLGSFDHYAT